MRFIACEFNFSFVRGNICYDFFQKLHSLTVNCEMAFFVRVKEVFGFGSLKHTKKARRREKKVLGGNKCERREE